MTQLPENPKPENLEDLLDRHGPDLALWPDGADAERARKAALGDRAFRAKLDAAKRLSEHLAVICEELDDSPSLMTAASRVELNLMRHAERRASERRILSPGMLARLAATVLLACAVGAGVGQFSDGAPITASADLSDDLLFGLMDVPFANIAAI